MENSWWWWKLFHRMESTICLSINNEVFNDPSNFNLIKLTQFSCLSSFWLITYILKYTKYESYIIFLQSGNFFFEFKQLWVQKSWEHDNLRATNYIRIFVQIYIFKVIVKKWSSPTKYCKRYLPHLLSISDLSSY